MCTDPQCCEVFLENKENGENEGNEGKFDLTGKCSVGERERESFKV